MSRADLVLLLIVMFVWGIREAAYLLGKGKGGR
jgi:hypothetical protein